jgi:hypothetical protein
MTSHSGEFTLSVSLGTASFSAEGATAVVLEVYEDFKKLLASIDLPPAPDPGHPQGKIEEGEPKPRVTPTPSEATELPLKPYLAGLKLKGNRERVTAIVAWGSASGNHDALKLAEIEALWKKTPFKAPGNLPRDVRNAETEGWLHRDGKVGSPDAAFHLTGYGQQIVEGWKTTESD